MCEAGLTGSGVTVDTRRLSIGYADRRDRGRAALRTLIEDRRHDSAHVLIVGDEAQGLLPVDDVWTNGSQSSPISSEEGSSRLLRLLRDQLRRRTDAARTSFPEPTADPAWRYAAKGFDPFREREIETLLTIANGESGTRGSVEEGSAVSTPATLVAGVFGDGTAEPRFRQPVPAPDWAGLRLIVDGLPLHLANGEILEHERVLDMCRGVVYRFWRQRDGNGRTVAVRTARFASLADRQILAVRAEATLEDRGGRLVWQGAVGISHAGGSIKETQFQSLDSTRLIARTAGRGGGGHALAVTTRPAQARRSSALWSRVAM